VPRRYFLDLLDDDVARAFDGTCARLTAAGVVLDDVVIPHASDIAAIYLQVALTEAAAFHARTLESRPDDYTPTVRVRLEAGRYVLAEDYLRALRGREVLRGGCRPRSTAVTVCCCPPWRCRRRRSAPPRSGRGGWLVRNVTTAHACSTSPGTRRSPFMRRDRYRAAYQRSSSARPRLRCCNWRFARSARARRAPGSVIPVVIRNIFHSWEHRLASVTKNRVVRPFEWGLDWLSLEGAGGLGGWGAGQSPDGSGPVDPAAHVERYVEEVMRDTEAFFTPPPTQDFVFTAGRSRAIEGRVGYVAQPSALTTPHEKTRSGRAGFERRARPTSNGRAPDRGRWCWCCRSGTPTPAGVGLSRMLARFGISALRLNLPYHDAMLAELKRADYRQRERVRTLQSCRQAVLDARRAIDWLAAQGFERIGILGTSLGSCLSLLTAAHDPRLRVAALNHVSPWFADVVWRGLSTRHVREGLEGHVDLEQLRRIWMPISPMAHLDAMRRTRSLLVYARYDLTFPWICRAAPERLPPSIPHESYACPAGTTAPGWPPSVPRRLRSDPVFEENL
jgi:hypothetical protein